MKTHAALTASVLLSAAYAWAAPDSHEDGDVTDTTGNLVHNGDFEIVSSDCPPSGWTMWGAQKYKIPANYTRDETVVHRGKGSFRIYHPGNTSGYVVSAPEHAIRPRAGKVYTVSFDARSDRDGSSTFGFTACESVRPFVEAPSPGRWPIEVTGSWQRFQFEIHEGWDFFADRSRYLLLTFYPTQDNQEECTLWLDDVVVTEEPSSRDGRLLDASRLTYEPLQHRLEPGDRFEFTVDAKRRLGAATQNVGAVSFHRVAGWTGHPYNKAGEYTLPAETERAIREMRMPMTRYFNRHLGEWALELHGTAPYYVPSAGDASSFKEGEYGGPQTPVLATLSKDGSALYVVIANGSWSKAAPCRIEVRNFPISQAHGILLTHTDPDGRPLLERKDDAVSPLPVSIENDVLTCVIPPHAVAFLTMQTVKTNE